MSFTNVVDEGKNDYEICNSYTVELHWLEHLWNHQNMFGVVLIRTPGQEA